MNKFTQLIKSNYLISDKNVKFYFPSK